MADPKLRPEDALWLAILKREPALKGQTPDDVRKTLRERKFPDHLIERFLQEQQA